MAELRTMQIFFKAIDVDDDGYPKPRSRTYKNVTGWSFNDNGVMVVNCQPTVNSSGGDLVTVVLVPISAMERADVFGYESD